jgi:hypothetical protein
MGTVLFFDHPPAPRMLSPVPRGAGLWCILKRTEKRADAKR